jgi:integrase/recombinase XerD
VRYRSKLYVPFESWPKADRDRWKAVLKKGNQLFDESGTAAHLAKASRVSFRDAYARLIAFLSDRHKGLIGRPASEWLDPLIIQEYIAWQPESTGPRTLANNLYWLGLMLRYTYPERDWSWLLKISNRLQARARRQPQRRVLITSEALYLLGLRLMDSARTDDEGADPSAIPSALRYRDGLIIALLAAIPLRRRTLVALRIGNHVLRTGELWALDIPPELVKTKRSLAYSISAELSQRIDVYLRHFRDRVPGARNHNAMWPSQAGGPVSYDRIYKIIRKRIQAAFGVAVNPHLFRTAAGTLWSMHDPRNVRGVRDLLGHANFRTTEQFYIKAQSRVAGRTLAGAVKAAARKQMARV